MSRTRVSGQLRRRRRLTRWSAFLEAGIGLTLAACGPGIDSGIEADIVGTWEAVEASGGIIGETSVLSPGGPLIVFDGAGGMSETSRGGSRIDGTYRIERGPGRASQEDLLELTVYGATLSDDGPFEVSVVGDTLRLGSVVSDGFSFKLVRRGSR